ncbi:unnamed protein product, partial [Ilex paraguariensis]
MEEEPVASETATRRSKRTRAQTRTAEHQPSTANAKGRNDHDRTSENQEEREESFDDFDEPRLRTKRNRATESATVASRKTDQSLI